MRKWGNGSDVADYGGWHWSRATHREGEGLATFVGGVWKGIFSLSCIVSELGENVPADSFVVLVDGAGQFHCLCGSIYCSRWCFGWSRVAIRDAWCSGLNGAVDSCGRLRHEIGVATVGLNGVVICGARCRGPSGAVDICGRLRCKISVDALNQSNVFNSCGWLRCKIGFAALSLSCSGCISTSRTKSCNR